MSRKDYVRFAALFNGRAFVERSLVEEFADILAEDNPRFDRSKFLAASGF